MRELAARGWDVAVLARGRDGVDAAVAEVEAAGRRGLAVLADVSDREAVEAAADRVEAELGPIDLWVNDVMVGVFGRFLDTDPDDFTARRPDLPARGRRTGHRDHHRTAATPYLGG